MKQHVPIDAIAFDQRLAPGRCDPFDEVLRPGWVHMRAFLGIYHNERVRFDEERTPFLKGAEFKPYKFTPRRKLLFASATPPP